MGRSRSEQVAAAMAALGMYFAGSTSEEFAEEVARLGEVRAARCCCRPGRWWLMGGSG